MDEYGDDNGKVDHEAIAEEEFADRFRHRDKAKYLCPEKVAGCGNADLTDAAGELIERTAEQIGKTCRKDCERETCHILIGTQRYG